MATLRLLVLPKNEFQQIWFTESIHHQRFKIVVPKMLKKGKLISYSGDKKKDQNVPDMLLDELERFQNYQNVELFCKKGKSNVYKTSNLDGLNIILGFSRKYIRLHLRLN